MVNNTFLDFETRSQLLSGDNVVGFKEDGSTEIKLSVSQLLTRSNLQQTSFGTGIATGIFAYAEGSNTSSTGNYSHAEGSFTIAMGDYSHAEGEQTVSKGNFSHAQGRQTRSFGRESHAEGLRSVSIGHCSHAEGLTTTAGGSAAHTEGSGVSAIGDYSHAEGFNTVAEGLGSHAQGNYSYTEGNFSHAEGSNTVARGVGSHAEGSFTITMGNYSHAEGNGTTCGEFISATYLNENNRGIWSFANAVSGKFSYIIPNVTRLYGTATPIGPFSTIIAARDTQTGRLTSAEAFGLPSGFLSSVFFIAPGGADGHAEGHNTVVVGEHSHAENRETIAVGNACHAEGYRTFALGMNSHTEGSRTSAIDIFSHAEGFLTAASGIAAHAEGYVTVARGHYTHTEGYGSSAFNVGSHAEGYFNVASGAYAHAEGSGTRANALNSHSEGSNTAALAPGSHAEGSYCRAAGEFSHVEGYFTVASGNYAHAEGSGTRANGLYSHAEGFNTDAFGNGAHSEGTSTYADGNGAHSEGYNTKAVGPSTHAEGSSTQATGTASHAEGSLTRAVGGFSHAAGYRAVAAQTCTYAWSDGLLGLGTSEISTTRTGQYMVSASGGVFIPGNVGIGTDNNDNALTVNGTISAKTVLADIVGNMSPKFWIRTSGSEGQVAAISMDTLTWYPVQDGFSYGEFCRDASPIFYNGEWVTVYTCAFNSDKAEFGLARSTNLSTWTPYRVSVLGPEITPYTPNNTWAPEWFVDNGNYYVFLRQSTTPGQNYGAPGQGFVKCLNPGTWTQWTNFAKTSGLSTSANDPYIIKRGETYHLFICADSTGGANASDIVMRTSNSPFSGWSSTAVNLTSAMRAALWPGNGSAFFEGPSVVHMGGDWYRAFVVDGLINFTYAIDSFDGMQTWNQAIDKPLKYITPNYSIGRFLSGSGAAHGTVLTGTPEQYIALFASTKNQNGTVYQSVCAQPLVYQGNTATVYASAFNNTGNTSLCVKFRNGSPIVLATENIGLGGGIVSTSSDLSVRSLTGKYESSYTTVNTNSAGWSTGFGGTTLSLDGITANDAMFGTDHLRVESDYSILAGGTYNTIVSSDCVGIVGGCLNYSASSDASFIGSGSAHNIFGSNFSTIINGSGNALYQSPYSIILGGGASVIDNGNACTIINSVCAISDNSTKTNISQGLLNQSTSNTFVNINNSINTDVSECSYCAVDTSIDSIFTLNTNCVSFGDEGLSAIDCGRVATFNTFNSLISSSDNSITAGDNNVITSSRDILVLGGSDNRVQGSEYVTILNGSDNVSLYDNTYLFGHSLTASQADTTYTQNIINTNTVRTLELSAARIVLTAPNGTRYRLNVDNSGNLSTTAL